MNYGKTYSSVQGQVAQKVGHKCWQPTDVLMLLTLAVTRTHARTNISAKRCCFKKKSILYFEDSLERVSV